MRGGDERLCVGTGGGISGGGGVLLLDGFYPKGDLPAVPARLVGPLPEDNYWV